MLLRGVQWAAPDLDTPKMARSLARVWPRPLAEARREVVAHDGAAEMAAVRSPLFSRARPCLLPCFDAPRVSRMRAGWWGSKPSAVISADRAL